MSVDVMDGGDELLRKLEIHCLAERVQHTGNLVALPGQQHLAVESVCPPSLRLDCLEDRRCGGGVVHDLLEWDCGTSDRAELL